MSVATIYRHPDGPALTYSASKLIATDENGNSVSLPIGPQGMLELAAELVALAKDGGNLAEQAGAGAAMDCLNALLLAKQSSQGERISIIQNAIIGLHRTSHPERAAGGFAVVLEGVLQIGLANLQKGRAEE